MVWVRAGTAASWQASCRRPMPGCLPAKIKRDDGRRPRGACESASGAGRGFGMPNGRPHQPGNAVGASWEAPTWAVRGPRWSSRQLREDGKTGRGDGVAVTFAAVARLVGMAVHTTPKWNVLCAAVG